MTKRSRRRRTEPSRDPAAPGLSHTTPVKNEATGLETEDSNASYGRLRLPHERDEDTEAPADATRPEIEQAASDLDAGQVDTDNYGKARIAFRRRERRGR